MCLVKQQLCNYVERISEMLKSSDTSQRDLARLLGVTEQAVSNKMRGKARFSGEELVMMAVFFDVSLDYLTGISNYPSKIQR
jgi:transcriptional regulator with XRE-family HTH domain